MLLPLLLFLAQAGEPSSLRGVVTDPSGAAVPGAAVQLRGPRGEKRARTAGTGSYSFLSLAPGVYQIRISAKGFSIALKKELRIDQAVVFDAQLAIETEKQVVNVDDETAGVSTDAASNGGAVVLRRRQLAALSDDPDELAQQLEALAGPAPGPGGGQIYIDGFLGGALPPKSAIREVRINSNPFSPEYDRPGFGRIEIFTRPGSDTVRGEAMAQFNDQNLNSRNPLLAQRPPYQAQQYRLNIGGPLKKNKASFTLDVEHRQIDENAFILATTLDSNLNPVKINEAVPAPLSRTTVTPRLDYTAGAKNTLTARYQEARIDLDNQGVGDFNLATRAYNQREREHTVQLTETAMLSPKAINETRFQFMRSGLQNIANDATPSINVQGAFYGGGPSIGNSGQTTNSWELTNVSTYSLGRHSFKWGGRVGESLRTDTSRNNFSGTFIFFTLAEYKQGQPSQFSMNAGEPATRVNQTDAGLFVNDDWRARPNLALSYGIRYEAQTNIGDRGDWAPRLGIAWGLDGKANRPAKTVLRAGFGAFYDRVANTATLNSRRYDGISQQSYLIRNPAFFPVIPPLSVLQASQQPQFLQMIYSGIQSPRTYQTSVGVDRQFSRSSRVTVTYLNSRGVHLLDSRNINAPLSGSYPSGDRAIRLLTESASLMRLNQVIVSPNVNYRKLTLFGFYALSYGKDDATYGMAPADPYNLRAEWGPSTYGDVRQKLVLASALPLPLKLSVNPFFVASSGIPYNITTGLDPNNTGFPAARPALRGGTASFDANPPAGTPTIGRNYGRGPATVAFGIRISRVWSFGGRGASGQAQLSSVTGHEGGPPQGMFRQSTDRKYNLTFTVSTLNALNHANFAPPNGDLSSPYFGQYRSLGDLFGHMSGAVSYNRKIDAQLRFTF